MFRSCSGDVPHPIQRWTTFPVQPSTAEPSVSLIRNGASASLHATWMPQPDAVLYRLTASGWSAHVSPAVFAEPPNNVVLRVGWMR